MKISEIAAIFEAAGKNPVSIERDGDGYAARFEYGLGGATPLIRIVKAEPRLTLKRVILGDAYCGVKFELTGEPEVEPEPDPLDVNDPEVRAGLRELDRQIQIAARRLWASHPNNPVKLPEPPAGVAALWGDIDEPGARTYALKLTIPGDVYYMANFCRRDDGAYYFSGHRGKDNGARGAMGPRQLDQCDALFSVAWDMLTAALEARGWTHEPTPAAGDAKGPIWRQLWYPPKD